MVRSRTSPARFDIGHFLAIFLILFGGFTLVGLLIFAGSFLGSGFMGLSATKYNCVSTIGYPIGGSVTIDSVSCTNVGQCGFGEQNTYAVQTPGTYFTGDGLYTLLLDVSGSRAGVSFNPPIANVGGSQRFDLMVCAGPDQRNGLATLTASGSATSPGGVRASTSFNIG